MRRPGHFLLARDVLKKSERSPPAVEVSPRYGLAHEGDPPWRMVNY